MSIAVSVLDHDPELGAVLTAAEFALAREHAFARVVRYEKGDWPVSHTSFSASGLGLLVLDGLLVRKVTVGERTCAELLGPGDVVQPWVQIEPDSSIGADANCDVAQALRVAVLDAAFVSRLARWPAITGAVAGRLSTRAHWL